MKQLDLPFTKTARQLLAVIDGNSLWYRCHWIRPYSTNQLAMQSYKKALREIRATHAVMVFDPKDGDLYRKSLDSTYKAQRRVKSKDEIQLMRQFRKSLTIPVVVVKGRDGDDVAATLAKKSPIPACIITADKDLLQCIGDNVSIYCGMKKRLYKNDEDVISHKKIGVPARKVALYLALVGDTVDNVVGVKGIGPVKARRILKDSESAEDVARHLSREEFKQFDRALLMTRLHAVAVDLPTLESMKVRLL